MRSNNFDCCVLASNQKTTADRPELWYAMACFYGHRGQENKGEQRKPNIVLPRDN
jgi:hypothetical protein